VADFDTFKKYFSPGNEKVGYFATIAARGRPTLRPVSFFLVGRNICFCTGADNAKIKHLKKNRHVEVCIPVNRGRWRGYYRLAGKAALVTEPRGRKRILRRVPYPLETYWDGPDDSRLAVVVISAERSRYLSPGQHAEVNVKL
jgi:uncharacterized pyridoxamine 5'-phosphate oxidase family protein